jgi:hypothetical protein
MTTKHFEELAVQEYLKALKEKYDQEQSEGNTSIVWLCYILGGMKCLIADRSHNGLYAEFTYNKDKNECYLDIYKKEHNILIKGDK